MADSQSYHARPTMVCAGSWAGLPDLLQSEGLLGTYDIVLSAETIYSTDSQQQLLDCIKQVQLITLPACCVGNNQGMASFL